VEVNTTHGRMVVSLFNETPVHRDNFLALVREHYYDSTLLHRVVPEFLVQGGDPDSKLTYPGQVMGTGGPTGTLPAEPRPELHHFHGALAAAPPTGSEDPTKNSHGSQFFFVVGRVYEGTDLDHLVERAKALGDSLAFSLESRATYTTSGGLPHMDGQYTVFGEVVSGQDVLDLITTVPCDQQDRPLTDVRIWMRELP
jgi:cyclophilin family peptidyl-prolyl cis-trans isomerase